LGDLFDAVGKLFAQDPEAQFVMVESLCPTEEGDDGARSEAILGAESVTECAGLSEIEQARGG
jgi:hypothetical protein